MSRTAPSRARRSGQIATPQLGGSKLPPRNSKSMGLQGQRNGQVFRLLWSPFAPGNSPDDAPASNSWCKYDSGYAFRHTARAVLVPQLVREVGCC